MSRTNVVLEDVLVRRAKAATGIKTTRRLLDHSLRELLRRKRQRDLLLLRGRVDWRGDLAALRRGRTFP